MHNFFLVNIQNNMHASPIFHFTIFFLMIILRNNAWLRQSLFRNQRFMLDAASCFKFWPIFVIPIYFVLFFTMNALFYVNIQQDIYYQKKISIAQNEKCVKYMANSKAFHKFISSNINLLFLKSTYQHKVVNTILFQIIIPTGLSLERNWPKVKIKVKYIVDDQIDEKIFIKNQSCHK